MSEQQQQQQTPPGGLGTAQFGFGSAQLNSQSQLQSDELKEKPCLQQENRGGEGSGSGTGLGFAPLLPQVKHEEVVANRDLFFETLNTFHSVMGTKFMVPTIGGKELDLHQFYVEVTARGGIQQAINDRKWKQIINTFNFPKSTTSASYVLRKYYLSLLKEYERIYFLEAQGRHSAAPLPPLSPIPQSVDNGAAHPGSDEVQPEAKKRKAKDFDMPIVGVDPTSSVDQPVTGVIHGKFDYGYFVKIKLGAEILEGVLYHVPSGVSGSQHAGISCFQSTNNFDATDSGINVSRKKKKERVRKRDPDHPKPNRSGYNFFFAEQHARLKALHPDKDREISKMIGESWNKLNEEERAVYQDFGLKDKERYKREMQKYKEKLKGESHTSEVSNQQPGEIRNFDDHKPKYHSPVGEEQKGVDLNMASNSTQPATLVGVEQKGSDLKMAFPSSQPGTTAANITAEQISSDQNNDCMKKFLEQGACS